jgi:hypothetical protein
MENGGYQSYDDLNEAIYRQKASELFSIHFSILGLRANYLLRYVRCRKRLHVTRKDKLLDL